MVRVQGVELWGRYIRRAVLTCIGVVAVWLVVCTSVVAFPQVDAPGSTDATYFLSSDGGLSALQDGHDMGSGEVVLSRPRSSAANPVYAICEESGVTCIAPVPETTQGEAEAFTRLAQQRGWTSVSVVSQTSHVARVRILMGRCFPGRVRVMAIPEHGLKVWLRAFVHENGAMVKVALTPGCHDRLPWER